MPEHPNIVLFMPETLRADAGFGDPSRRARTPNMDTLGEEGVRFERCYAQHSVCAPSRCSMFTGLYPHTAGRRTLGTLIRPHEHNLFRDLREAGYETLVFGKNDMMFPETAKLSFDSWDVEVHAEAPNPKAPYPQDHRLYYSFLFGKVGEDGREWRDDDWACVQNALNYLDQEHDKPFCILLPLGFVHPPYLAPEPFYSMYDRAKVPPPVQADTSRKRRYVRMIHEHYRLGELTDDEWREIRALYFAMTSRVDHQLGQIVAKLKERSLWNSTAVFCFSDHGDFTGDYGLVEKWFSACEDCILRIPLIFRAPGQLAVGTRAALVEMVDLYPTVLDVAGIDPGHYHFGKSVLPLCDPDAADTHREVVFGEGGHNIDESYIHDIATEYGGVYYQKHHLWYVDPAVMGKAWMVRDERYKYIYCPDEFDELYDMRADPGETSNLADDPALATTIRRMKGRLLEWMSRTADHIPEDENRCGWPGEG